MIRSFYSGFCGIAASHARFASAENAFPKVQQAARKYFEPKQVQNPSEESMSEKFTYFPVDSLNEKELEELDAEREEVREWNAFMREKLARAREQLQKEGKA